MVAAPADRGTDALRGLRRHPFARGNSRQLDADLKKAAAAAIGGKRGEMEVLTSPKTYDFHPERAWERLKTRVRKPKELAVLMEVAGMARAGGAKPRDRSAQPRAQGRCGRPTSRPQCADRASNGLANLRSLPKGFDRSKWGADIVAAVQRGIARDPASLPEIERPRGNFKTARRSSSYFESFAGGMTSERQWRRQQGDRERSDDLEQIAADDNADVAALHGWRRELFGEAALALETWPSGAGDRKGPGRREGRSELDNQAPQCLLQHEWPLTLFPSRRPPGRRRPP